MKAISIRQPWAWAIIRNGKDIENRKWKTKVRGLIAIHASKQGDYEAPKELLNAYNDATKSGDPACQMGGFIGTVEIIDCVQSSDSKWFQGPNGFVLNDPKPMVFIPWKGQLNFFEVDVTFGFTGKPIWKGNL